jgi:hypothetical protein
MKEIKTARGKTFNIVPLIKKNETAVAVGNMNVNARGDLLGKGGKIVKTYKQRENLNTIKQEESIGLGQESDTETEYPKLINSYTRKGKIIEEWEHEDGSIEERTVK